MSRKHYGLPRVFNRFQLSLSGNQSGSERTFEVYYGEDLLWKHFIFRQTMIQVLDWRTTTIFCLQRKLWSSGRVLSSQLELKGRGFDPRPMLDGIGIKAMPV